MVACSLAHRKRAWVEIYIYNFRIELEQTIDVGLDRFGKKLRIEGIKIQV